VDLDDRRWNPINSEAPKLRTKVLDIGDWNMDATATLTLPHGLNYKKIRVIHVMVRTDDDVTYDPLMRFDNATDGTVSGGHTLSGTTDIALFRRNAGTFDNPTYDSTGFNRGWITITYEP
jgi:hypothetical protein